MKLLLTTMSLLIIYMAFMISAITSIPISEKQDVPAYFEKYTDRDNCEIIPTKKINIRQHYGTICYENGMWLEFGFGGMPDSIYAERVQPVKDSLRGLR